MKSLGRDVIKRPIIISQIPRDKPRRSPRATCPATLTPYLSFSASRLLKILSRGRRGKRIKVRRGHEEGEKAGGGSVGQQQFFASERDGKCDSLGGPQVIYSKQSREWQRENRGFSAVATRGVSDRKRRGGGGGEARGC